MKLRLISPPVSEPLTLSEVKAQVRLLEEETSEDAYLLSLITTARGMAQAITNRQIEIATYRLSLPCFPSRVSLAKAPYSNSTPAIVKYLDENDTEQTLNADAYELDEEEEPAEIHFNGDLPVLSSKINPVKIEFQAGYPSGEVPAGIKQAMLLMIGHWYENREDSVMKMPTASERLLTPLRLIQVP